jgi:hypothetical protein
MPELESELDLPEVSESTVRLAALPAALLFAWLAVKVSPGGVRMLTMWVHESGHALTAWTCGHLAFPGPWFTPVSSDRSYVLSTLILGLLGYGGYRAWAAERWFWVAAAAAAAAVVITDTFVLSDWTAQQLITFGGDGGCLVLGTLLMLTVYSRETNPVRKNHLRWGFLVIGALALVDVSTVWNGPISSLPLGENENGLSDPSVLTEQDGWNLLVLIVRYQQLARGCLGVLAVVYVTTACLELLDN